MSHRDELQLLLERLMKPAFIASPLFLFLIYLLFQHKISNLELVIFLIVTTLPFVMIVRHFQKKLKLLDRIAALQTHDNKATKENQFLLVNIMEKLSDPLLLLDSSKRVLMANNSAHKLLGDHILKQDILIFIRNSGLNDAIERALETGNPESCEFEYGKPVANHYLTRIHLIDLANGQAINSDQANADRKPHQNHSKKQYIFLAIYDISAIKRTDKMRADFVANASHELRTPLASILGFVETLQGPARDDEQAHDRFLKIMHDEASRMSRLIEDLLSLSRIERDEHIPPSERVNLPHLIESVIDVLEPQAKDKNMTICFSPEALNDITGDHDQLNQVFQNLIENAIKYGQENTDIEVTCTENILPSPLSTKEIKITITNEGPGIPAEHLPRLMERFYRVDSARSRSLGGTGLGLAIVKHIIQRHRGRIFFESKINSTTKVTLFLPIQPLS